jgi:NitT/TauT family transport system substrate-binding protein
MRAPAPVFRPFARLALAAILVGMLAGFAGCGPRGDGGPADPADPLPIVLQTDWLAQAEHGGFYAAWLNGHYKAAGFAVEIRQGGPNAHTLQRVVLGEADFSMHRSDDLLVQASRGVPLALAGVIMQKDPQALMFHASSGIREFADLDGRAIMATPGLNYLEVLRRRFDIDFTVIPHDYGMERFLADRNFIQQCFVTNEPFFVRQAGAEVETLLIADSGFAPYQVWYTRRSYADRHPERVRAFNAATIAGWRDYLFGDPSAVHEEILRRNPRTSLALLEYSRGQLLARELVTGPGGDPATIGRLDPARLQAQIDELAAIGLLAGPVAVEAVIDPAFTVLAADE